MTTKTELGLKTSHTSAGTKGACSCWGLQKTNVSDWKHRNLFSPYFNFWSVLHSQYLPLANLKADFICMVPWPISVKKTWRLLMASTTTTSLQQWEDNGKKAQKTDDLLDTLRSLFFLLSILLGNDNKCVMCTLYIWQMWRT